MGSREREVRGVATSLLEEVSSTSTPVDPFQIAVQKGIRISERPGFPAGIFGAMYLDSEGFGIVVSTGCYGPGHRAFTAAHELGHYHIDGHLDAMFEAGNTQALSVAGHFRSRRDPLEREADWFASELLMPRGLAGPVARDLPGTIDDLAGFADQFGVSLSCAAVRYAELTDNAVAVVISRDGAIEWIAFSDRMREHSWTRRAWRAELTPPGSATSRVTGHGSRGARDDGQGLLCEWFDGAPDDLVVDEECLCVGEDHRVITTLSAGSLPTREDIEEEAQDGGWRERDWRDALRGFDLD